MHDTPAITEKCWCKELADGKNSTMFRNMHYLAVIPNDSTPYLMAPKLAESWPVEGLRLYFSSKRMQRTYALSYWLKYSAQNPLDWITPSEEAWGIDLSRLRAAFDSADRMPSGDAKASWPTWFKGKIAIIPEWEAIDGEQGANRYAFILTEWQVTKSKLPPIPGSGTTIIQGDQIHLSDIHGNVGHVGSRSSNVSVTQHTSVLPDEVLSGLADELALLRSELRRHAKTVDDDRTVAALGEAEEAARNGDGGAVLSFLKKSGAWALKTATEIGVPIAQKAIETAVGISSGS